MRRWPVRWSTRCARRAICRFPLSYPMQWVGARFEPFRSVNRFRAVPEWKTRKAWTPIRWEGRRTNNCLESLKIGLKSVSFPIILDHIGAIKWLKHIFPLPSIMRPSRYVWPRFVAIWFKERLGASCMTALGRMEDVGNLYLVYPLPRVPPQPRALAAKG